MPKPINRQTPQGRKGKAAAACNNRAVVKVLKGDEAAFARVEKELGFSQFLVRYHDGRELHVDLIATPRGTFSAGGKVRVRICVGDIVLLDAESLQELAATKKRGKKMIVDIMGKLEKKEAQKLYTDGRIDKSVYQSAEGADGEDDLFDYEAAPAEGEADDDEEVNVDDI